MTSSNVKFVKIDEDHLDQRLDNFLISQFKNIPKSVIYRIIRKGEVRVNKGRIKPEYKLQINDIVRIPPIKQADTTEKPIISTKLSQIQQLQQAILFEDESLLIINKPAGIAVHGGSGLNYGVIEALRALRPEHRFLELVHRIDRETSGILLVAKKRRVLVALHEQLRFKQVKKDYLTLVQGVWQNKNTKITAPLLKNELKSGERVVVVNPAGKVSETKFLLKANYGEIASLLLASPVTGRTHQIRVHCQFNHAPIAGDEKYGNRYFNDNMKEFGLKRLFLHAHNISFIHPTTLLKTQITAPLPTELTKVLNSLELATGE